MPVPIDTQWIFLIQNNFVIIAVVNLSESIIFLPDIPGFGKQPVTQLAQEKSPRPTQAAVLLRCFSYLRPYWKAVVGVYAAMVVIDLIAMVNPQLIRWAIDEGINSQKPVNLTWAVSGLLLLVLIKGVLTFLEGKWTETASQNVAYDLRNALQRKITDLSFSFHDKAQAGDLLSRAIQDVERIRFLTGRAVFRIIESIFLMLITSVVMIWMDPRLGLLAMLSIPFLVFQSVRFGRVYRPLSLKIQKQMSVLTTRVEQNLRGARVIKTFAQESAEIERFNNENQLWMDLSAKATRLQTNNMPLLLMIANIGSVGILLYGGYQKGRGAFTGVLGSLAGLGGIC